MPIVATRSNASARGYGWSATIPESLDGIKLLTPTTIDKAGTGSTASINTNGSVTYVACTGIGLNGVFSATYDNYMIVVQGTESLATSYYLRLRVSGTDNTTASSYGYQSLSLSSTTESSARAVNNFWTVAAGDSTFRNGFIIYLYAPFIAQETAYRSVTVDDLSGAKVLDYAGTHNQATSYDGFNLWTSGATLTGQVAVYGLVN